jgi:penicillin amidase
MKKFLILIVLLLAFIVGAIYLWLNNTAPTYNGSLQFASIKDSTHVIYDNYGVPHIYASNAKDAYFSLGYTHAQERLFQMDIIRRLSQGKLAEILGPSLISTDKKMRTLGFSKMAKENAEEFLTQNGAMQQQAQAYLDGINAFIEQDRLPIEFKMLGYTPQKFVTEDVYATIGYMALGFSIAMTTEPVMQSISEQLGEDYLKNFESDSISGKPAYRPYAVREIIAKNILKDMESFPYDLAIPYWEGSNSWLISKSKTKSGKTIFANDTHIGYSQPAVWFEAYLEYPGTSIYGYYLAGVPFAIMGHNQNLAWGLTIFPLDNMDLYYETVNINNSKYLQGNAWKDFDIYPQTIKVKDSTDVKYDVLWTNRGPIVSEDFEQVKQGDSNKLVSLYWTPNHIKSQVLKATFIMSHANNIGEFEKAMPFIDILGLNVMYADREDNIAWWATGLIPKISADRNTKLYQDGATDTLEHEYYSFSHNPRLLNPSKGFIVTANNSPGIYDSMSIPGYYAPGYRANRITELLSANDQWDIQGLKAVQLDVFSHRDLHIRDIILNEISPELKSNPEYKDAIETLQNWDGNYNINSVGATIINRLIYESMKNSIGSILDKNRFKQLLNTYTFKTNLERLFVDKSSPWWQNKRQEIFDLSIKETIDGLKSQLGTDIDKWQWGEIHQLVHVHPIGRKKPFDKIFNVGPFPKSGTLEVVDKEGFVYSDDAKITIKSGPAMRCLLDFARPDSAIAIIPTGQSGNFMSPHYSDQAQMFVDGEYRQQIINKKDLKSMQRSLWLLPM